MKLYSPGGKKGKGWKALKQRHEGTKQDSWSVMQISSQTMEITLLKQILFCQILSFL